MAEPVTAHADNPVPFRALARRAQFNRTTDRAAEREQVNRVERDSARTRGVQAADAREAGQADDARLRKNDTRQAEIRRVDNPPAPRRQAPAAGDQGQFIDLLA